MIELKTPGEIDAMRAAGRVVAAVHARVREAAAPGVSLRELDELARTIIAEAGAGSSFLGYHPSFGATPFPGVICTSVNGVLMHGLPTGYRLRDGDLLSVDCGAHVDGWHADAAVSFTVGTARPQDLALIETTERMLAAGIAAAVPGATIGDIGHAMSPVGRGAGYGVQNDFAGHGIGRAMHEDPFVPNEGRPGRGLRLRPGLVIAIEPSLMAGGRDEYEIASDGWSICSADGSRGAHVEHTVAITDDGPEILTLP
ncbi:type I methionyl aminopeptidase [Thermomonospora cellulosilytica]|uniref:Methionine aminopeptidase n=1 Tax=Thermomonospora cellulosilytica TaxID=1411118 RepID=A0A7W3N021_9ACTN|nr:type I methionyl aminopeptidase [Thermomonospora cellulosilytica]MBA9004987.1 methionyl aminopeptidase [Thermomonospora cellulosilytica]